MDSGQTMLLASGATAWLPSHKTPWSLVVIPSAGASAAVGVSCSPTDRMIQDRHVVALETITDATIITYPGPVTFVVVTAIDGDAIIEGVV
ncbi:MAG: hypothetical protein AB1479_09870 [Pseudomonadota bacterium]